MKVRAYYDNWFPKLIKVYAITIYPFVLFGCDIKEATESTLMTHETIHVRQVRKIGFFRFYFDYWRQYFVNRFKGMSDNDAYEAISYEKEAYEKEQDMVMTPEELSEFGVK